MEIRLKHLKKSKEIPEIHFLHRLERNRKRNLRFKKDAIKYHYGDVVNCNTSLEDLWEIQSMVEAYYSKKYH
jgi:hypothetical protein